ncbi:hypothetical protein ACPRNU_13875 [Chromobacterium vaccinii]|uniref:hypothetical protein n=1 Tax=Chromobacterium vaccinii TaxID=1108595 RepID=UPI003C789CD0
MNIEVFRSGKGLFLACEKGNPMLGADTLYIARDSGRLRLEVDGLPVTAALPAIPINLISPLETAGSVAVAALAVGGAERLTELAVIVE